MLDCLLMSVRNAVEIEDIGSRESEVSDADSN